MTNSIFITDEEASKIKEAISNKSSLMGKSFIQLQANGDTYLKDDLIVPKNGAAGGYEHTTHMCNAVKIQTWAKIYKILKDEKYAKQAEALLDMYVEKYLQLPFAKTLTQNPPGRMFHQILNEQMWLIRVVEGYSYLKNYLSEEKQKAIEEKVITPICELMIETNSDRFDIIHNHGIWAVGCVGIAGIIMGKDDYVEKAVKGLKLDSKTGGFRAQLDNLLSPDGYYEEGPYYLRFALWPMYLFAEALERHCPDYKIFEYRDQIIKKTLYSMMDMVLNDGQLPSLNDAYRSTSIYEVGGPCVGFLYATALIYCRYGADDKLLWIAQKQDEVMINIAGLNISNALEDLKTKGKCLEYKAPESCEIKAGKSGTAGAIGVLRSKDGNGKEYRVLMSYGTHGMREHGHYDGLSIMVNMNDSSVLTDYGCARWANLTQKYEGTYAPENFSYAKHTVAHNTIVVDKATHHFANGRTAEKHDGKCHIFNTSDPKAQLMSAKTSEYADGCDMQRSVILFEDYEEFEHPILIDIFKIISKANHTYDLPFHYLGQAVEYNFPKAASNTQLTPAGDGFGYQHLWREGTGDPRVNFGYTWLHEGRFYSINSSVTNNTKVIYGTIGANDPEDHLRPEPYIILRQTGKTHAFASVLESHGMFDEAQEVAQNSFSKIDITHMLATNEQGTIVCIRLKSGVRYTVMVSNIDNVDDNTQHSIISEKNQHFSWQGSHKIIKHQS